MSEGPDICNISVPECPKKRPVSEKIARIHKYPLIVEEEKPSQY